MADKLINYEIITKKGVAFKGMATYISCQSSKFLLGILPNHDKMISTVDFSILEITYNDSKSSFVVGEGFLEVDEKGDVRIIVSSVEKPNEIDIKRANQSLERAKNRLESNDPIIDKERAKKSLKRAEIRLIAAQKN